MRTTVPVAGEPESGGAIVSVSVDTAVTRRGPSPVTMITWPGTKRLPCPLATVIWLTGVPLEDATVDPAAGASSPPNAARITSWWERASAWSKATGVAAALRIAGTFFSAARSLRLDPLRVRVTLGTNSLCRLTCAGFCAVCVWRSATGSPSRICRCLMLADTVPKVLSAPMLVRDVWEWITDAMGGAFQRVRRTRRGAERIARASCPDATDGVTG